MYGCSFIISFFYLHFSKDRIQVGNNLATSI
jgi:hypothetical protein